eukprot:544163-Pleurochrysis_carterae.AAC.1
MPWRARLLASLLFTPCQGKGERQRQRQRQRHREGARGRQGGQGVGAIARGAGGGGALDRRQEGVRAGATASRARTG